MAANPNQTIVIKKIKKGGHGHHGGAWKVAFADFVTAMMAFFLLMWLLESASEEQKRGIAGYFQNPMGASTGMGASNALIDTGGGLDAMKVLQGVPTGSPGDGQDRSSPNFDPMSALEVSPEELLARVQAAERRSLEQLKLQFEAAIEENPDLADFRDQLRVDVTGEGLRIQIIDEQTRSMFEPGSARLEEYTRAILHEIARVVNTLPNRLSISGHTDRTALARTDGYSNWELSAERANAARRELLRAGIPEEKIARVVGMGSSVLYDRRHPTSPVNRRITIVLLNKATDEAISSESGPLS
jgi:chemotaxis protein MotB